MNFKMNPETYRALWEIYAYLCDGRVFLARELLEQIIDIDSTETR
jgi:hypothetical protein